VCIAEVIHRNSPTFVVAVAAEVCGIDQSACRIQLCHKRVDSTGEIPLHGIQRGKVNGCGSTSDIRVTFRVDGNSAASGHRNALRKLVVFAAAAEVR